MHGWLDCQLALFCTCLLIRSCSPVHYPILPTDAVTCASACYHRIKKAAFRSAVRDTDIKYCEKASDPLAKCLKKCTYGEDLVAYCLLDSKCKEKGNNGFNYFLRGGPSERGNRISNLKHDDFCRILEVFAPCIVTFYTWRPHKASDYMRDLLVKMDDSVFNDTVSVQCVNLTAKTVMQFENLYTGVASDIHFYSPLLIIGCFVVLIFSFSSKR